MFDIVKKELMNNLTFDEQGDGLWVCPEFHFRSVGESAQIILTSHIKPDQNYIDRVIHVLESVDDLTLKAAAQILNNYSYEYFKDLGIDEALLLKEETPEAMSRVVMLGSVFFYDAQCKEFEMSFFVPWDDEHSFDIEFKDGKAKSCSVNG